MKVTNSVGRIENLTIIRCVLFWSLLCVAQVIVANCPGLTLLGLMEHAVTSTIDGVDGVSADGQSQNTIAAMNPMISTIVTARMTLFLLVLMTLVCLN